MRVILVPPNLGLYWQQHRTLWLAYTPSQPLAPAPLWRLVVAILLSGFLTYAIARGFQF
jgi:hypothetical protein